VYAGELTDRGTGGGGAGSLQAMAENVEGWIETPIVLGTIEGARSRSSGTTITAPRSPPRSMRRTKTRRP